MTVSAFDYETVKLGINPSYYDVILCSIHSKQECSYYMQEKDIFNKVFLYNDEEHKKSLLEIYNNNSHEEFKISKHFCTKHIITGLVNFIISKKV